MAWTKEDAARLMRGEVLGKKIQCPMLLIKPELKPFKSHVDGTIINTHRQLQDHNRRNNVLPMQEFEPLWAEKEKEREKIFDPEKASNAERKEDIIQAVEQLTR